MVWTILKLQFGIKEMNNINLMKTKNIKLKVQINHDNFKKLFNSKIFQFSAVLIFIIVMRYFDVKEAENKNRIIKKDGIIVKAILNNVFTSSTVTTVSYSYTYNSNIYKGSVNGNIPYRIIKCKKSRDCIGDTILIKMSRSHPEYTTIVRYSSEEEPVK